jgi:hypothetical protein
VFNPQFLKKKKKKGWAWWFMLIIPATWEAEIGNILVSRQLRQKCS